MTKLKSKKMTKSTFAIIIMAIAMVAMLAFGGTYAYFTAQSTKAATEGIKTAKVELGAFGGGFSSITKTTPVSGDTILSNTAPVTVANSSNVDTWVFIQISAEIDGEKVTSYLASDNHTALTGDETAGLYLSVNTTDWQEFGDGWYGKKASVAKEIEVSFPVTVKFYANSNAVYDNETSAKTDGTGSKMDKDVTIKFEAKSIQKDFVNDISAAATALSIPAKS